MESARGETRKRRGESVALRGMHKGGAAPFVGGAAARGVPAGLAGAACVAAWGEPARPGFPPEGETGKEEFDFLAAAGESLGHVVLGRIALVRQLRGPHLRTWPWWRSRSSIELTAAVSPSSFPQSSTGRFEVSKVLARS